MAWLSNGAEKDSILYKRSENNGGQWDNIVKLVESESSLQCPNITTDGGSNVHLVYRAGNEIYYKCSTDRGVTWGPDLRLTFDPDNSNNPSIAVSGSRLHVVWHDDRVPHQGTPEVYYKSNEFRRLQTDFSNGRHLARETWFGSPNLHMVMKGKVVSENDKVYYTKTTDAGATWTAPEFLGEGNYPTVGLVELPLDVYPPWYAVCVAFKPLTPNNQLIYKFYNPSVGSWSQDYTLTTQADPGPPSLIQDYYGNTYVGYSCGDGRVYCQLFPYDFSQAPSVETIDNNTDCSQPSLGIDANGQPHASWRRGTNAIWYAPRAGGSWSPKEQIDQRTGFAQQPFAEGFANYMYVPWSEGSGNASEIWKGEKDLTLNQWRWVQVPTNGKSSESPVQALGEFTTWSDGTTNPGDYNDIYYWREGGNPTVVESNPNEWSYWPHSVMWDDWFGFKHLAVAWTESPNIGQPPFRVTCPHSMYHPECYYHAASATWGGSGAGPTGSGSNASGAGGR